MAHVLSTGFAEAMTLFAVGLRRHLSTHPYRTPWMAYYMFPYPSTMGLWPQFRSPLIWDVFAVSTYGTVSLLFWFVGLIPDLATLRDRAVKKPMQNHLWHAGLGVGAAPRAIGTVTNPRTCFLPAWQRLSF